MAPAVMMRGVVLGAVAVLGAGTCLAGTRPAASPMAVPSTAWKITVVMGPREALPATLARAGLGKAAAAEAAAAVADAFDPVVPHPGQALGLEVSDGPAGLRLERMSIQAADVGVRLWRDQGGRLVARRARAEVYVPPQLVGGVVDGSLYQSLVGAGVAPAQAAKVTSLFGRHLDLVRDVESGDRFRLVFDRRMGPGGRPLGPAQLVFGEVRTRAGPATLYRVGETYVAGEFGPGRSLLLRTPIDGARITSNFGPRMHPILGYTRMHQGVDFGAPVGAPVFAAGDGVIEEARWAGGYGRWLKIRHAQGLETAYAHLSAWATGIRPGARVRQGQVVGYVGETGLATGPHLHYEVIEAGRPIDPRAVALAKAEAPTAAAKAAFRARKAMIDAMIAPLQAG
jgi:murein DD-endopeptidase MepM/ murein hydrolase activator NlpD